VQPYDLHGTLYYRILFSLGTDDERVAEARLAHEAVYANPAVGDHIVIQRILNMVIGIDRAPLGE
jgi:hypothetical protein